MKVLIYAVIFFAVFMIVMAMMAVSYDGTPQFDRILLHGLH